MANSPKITFRCPTPLLERLTQRCSDLGVRQSAGIVRILEAALSDTTLPTAVGHPEPDPEWSAFQEPDEAPPPDVNDDLEALLAEFTAQPG